VLEHPLSRIRMDFDAHAPIEKIHMRDPDLH